MKKFLLVALLTIFVLSFSTAKEVDEITAKQIAQNFLQETNIAPNARTKASLALVYKASSNKSSTSASIKALNYYYVFNAGTDGFVIVSGDDNAIPILGYSDEDTFNAENMPEHVAKWLSTYRNEIQRIINSNTSQSPEVAKKWKRLSSSISKSNRKTTAVSPILKTKWGQSPYVNALAPGGSVTGCVATGMAQVLKHWNYPTTGSGFHSYNHKTYGTLSANFGSTTYDWASMPNTVSSANSAVATLMYHLGVSVDMNYSPSVSGAWVISSYSPGTTHNSEYALKTYFGYENIQGLQKKDYSEAAWMTLMKTELDANRPILYAGFGGGGGHCFVADGYDGNDFIHFNWGWGGLYDGYFAIGALNPSGTGTGGGTGGYNSGHQAVIGIEPPAGQQNYNMVLHAAITPSPSNLGYGNGFTVTANMHNQGSNDFNGDYAAIIFDASYNFVGYVDSLIGYNLGGGNVYQNPLTFTSAGNFGMLPGTYHIGIFYRPTGGKWKQMNSGSYSNPVQMTVSNYNDIALYAPLTTSPAATLTKGEAVTVSFNILNSGASTFYGDYVVGLYELDGSWVQTIGTISEVNGLSSSNRYVNPIELSTSEVTADPGTYLVAVQHTPTGGSTALTGSGPYENPIKVTVVQAPLLADAYENNDYAALAYSLPVSIFNSEAYINSTGSNVHVSSDVDYYKINLASGYNYLVSARIHDAYNSGDGKTYTLDGLLSYSTDGGVSWSDTYDHVLPSDINLSGGGEITFKVAPFFAGNTGTYDLSLYVFQTNIVGTKEIATVEDFTVYPNPAHNSLTITSTGNIANNSDISIVNATGQVVLTSQPNFESNNITIDLSDLSNGVYYCKMSTGIDEKIRKFTIVK